MLFQLGLEPVQDARAEPAKVIATAKADHGTTRDAGLITSRIVSEIVSRNNPQPAQIPPLTPRPSGNSLRRAREELVLDRSSMGTAKAFLPAWLAGSLLAGCAGAGSARAPAPSPSRLSVFTVEPDAHPHANAVSLHWRGPLTRFGLTFALIDDGGYRGLVRTVARSKEDCDDCAGPLVDAERIAGPGAVSDSTVAVGPVDGPLPRAKIQRAPSASPGAQWQPALFVDLNGDGRWDFQQMQRCGHYAPSGCSGRVCDVICTGVARIGARPGARDTHCQSFVPDLQDCPRAPGVPRGLQKQPADDRNCEGTEKSARGRAERLRGPPESPRGRPETCRGRPESPRGRPEIYRGPPESLRGRPQNPRGRPELAAGPRNRPRAVSWPERARKRPG